MMSRRSQLWTAFKEARRKFGHQSPLAQQLLESFQEVNFQYRNFELFARAKYELELVNCIDDAPKRFHSYIRNKKVGCPSVGPLRLPSGEITDSPHEMAEIFAGAFASVFVPEDPGNPARFQFYPGTMDMITISHEDVFNVLTALDTHSSAGPDGLHPSLLKHCAEELSYPLSIIFNKCFATSSVPRAWSQSWVKPLFKGKSRLDPLNYRPVNITSVVCKSMERIVVAHLMSFLEDSGILSKFQFDFRKSRSLICL